MIEYAEAFWCFFPESYIGVQEKEVAVMKRKIPRLVLAGTNSSCGKTTAVCALLQALVNRGLKTGAFKCGPDYIDPFFTAGSSARSAPIWICIFSRKTP